MRGELYASITKFINIALIPYQVAIYFNIYMIKSVFFGCRVVSFNQKQEQELKRICEELLLRKMGFSQKFPQNALYSRKIAIGIGIMELLTIIDMLKLKLYIENIRKGGNTAMMIKAREEL